MEIPKKIQIGGQILETQMCEELDGKAGKCCIFNGYIKIAESLNGMTQTDTSKLNTYIHEVVHTILDTMGMDNLSRDEVFVSSFAGFATEGLMSILNNKE